MSGYMLGSDGKTKGEALLMRSLPLVLGQIRNPLWNEASLNYKHIRNPVVDVLISSTANASDVYADKAPLLQECVVAWCIKTIQSSYFVGTYEEEVTSTFFNDTQGPYPWSVDYLPDEDIYMVDYFENVTIAAPPTEQNFSPWGWGINNDTMLQTVNVFDRMFPAFTTTLNSTKEEIFRWRTGSVTQVGTKKLNFNPWLLPNNITHHLKRLVESVSNVIRSDPSNEMVKGKAWDNEVYVRVRWAWLPLPIGLLLFSFIFLLATVIKSAAEKDQVSIRKNSAIATLLYGFPEHHQKRFAKSNLKGTPRTKAKELKVRLSPTRGWRARASSSSH